MEHGRLTRIIGHHRDGILGKPAEEAIHPVLLPLILQPELVLQTNKICKKNLTFPEQKHKA
jgi:hypothetical protein